MYLLQVKKMRPLQCRHPKTYSSPFLGQRGTSLAGRGDSATSPAGETCRDIGLVGSGGLTFSLPEAPETCCHALRISGSE
ncbi:hypothetical protein FKM82_005040 [Ascaphus truei]